MGFNGDLYGIPSGWWYTYPSEKYEFASWDDDIPNMMGNIQFMFQTTKQNDSKASIKFLINHGVWSYERIFKII